MDGRAGTMPGGQIGKVLMKQTMMKNKLLRILACVLSLLTPLAHAASEWNAQDYDLYPGDFNGDFRTDLLYVAKRADKGSGVALSNGEQLIAGHQVWNANGFGIAWHSHQFVPVLGDFNWDGRTDIFMHRQAPGDHYLLLAGADGTFSGASQTIPNVTGGFIWSGDQHRIISVKARNTVGVTTRGHRLFLQATRRGGSNAIFDTSPTQLITGAILDSNTWSDGYRGFQWNLRQSIVHSGDFNGDGNGDLLVQAKPDITLIDFDVSITVPTYRPQSFGIVYHPVGSGNVLLWDRMHAGVDWAADRANLIIGDFDGNGRDDVIVQARRNAGSAHLILANAATNHLGVSSPVSLSFSGLTNVGGNAYRLIAVNVNGTGIERIAGLYLQTMSPGGTNYIAQSLPGAGGSVSLDAQSEQYQSSPTPGTAVGSVAGAFGVGAAGDASYTIPISVPPGIAGLAPELALNYSSRAGNGLIGVGWTLKGLSVITRCPMTFEQDGRTDAVDLDQFDAYCLDGERLKAINNNNGSVGAEYRTEIESFQRVVSEGGVLHDPGSWTVKDKAGLTRFYGTSSDSRIELQGKSQAHVWAIKRIEDRFGNSIDFTYNETPAQSSFEPVEIRWGNSMTVVGRVHFEYWNTRSDPSTGYLAGSLIGTSRLLRTLDVYSRPSATQRATEASARVRSYFLNYQTNPNTSLMHLREVVQCDGGESSARRCLGSTKFRWQEGTPGFGGAINTGTPVDDTRNLRPVDLNGDGRTDYIYSFGTQNGNGQWGYVLSSLTNARMPRGWPTRGAPWSAIVIDYNSDGYQDILQTSDYGGGGVYEWIAGGPSGFASYNATSIGAEAHTHANTSTAVGDFDGDGTQDLMYAQRAFPSSILQLHLNQPGGFTARGTTLPQGGSNQASMSLGGIPLIAAGLGQWAYPHYGDQAAITTVNFDGDGRDDVLVRVGTGCEERLAPPAGAAYAYRCTGQRYDVYSFDPAMNQLARVWSITVDASNPEWEWMKVLDANGDGLSDVMYATASGWTLRAGTGSAAAGLAVAWSAASFSGRFRVLDAETRRYYQDTLSVALDADRLHYAQIVDFDRDGRADVMFPMTQAWFVLRNSGGAFLMEGLNTGMLPTGNDEAMIVDEHGDGLFDLIYPANDAWHVRFGRGPTGSVIDRITDGLGAVTQIQYAPLTEQSTQGTDELYGGHMPVLEADGAETEAAFPYQNVLMPLTVVSQIAQDNGEGTPGSHSVQTAYKYAGLKTHRRGRGLLGFARVTSQNVNTTIVTDTRNAQRWPYTGMVLRADQRYPSVTTVTSQTVDLSLYYTGACETQFYCPPVHVDLPVTVTVDGPAITTTTNTLSALNWSSQRWFPYTLKSTETVYPLQGSAPGVSALRRTITEQLGFGGSTTTNRFDDYGNPYYVRVSVDDGDGGDVHITETSSAYRNDASENWCLGRLRDLTVVHSKSRALVGNPGEQSVTRHSSFEHLMDRCVLDLERIEPGTAFEQVTEYEYDAWGNRELVTVTSSVAGTEARRTGVDFSSTQGQFPQYRANANIHEEWLTWDPRFGTQLTLTGPNGLMSRATHDSFGRLKSDVTIEGLGVYKSADTYWCAYLGCYDGRSVTVVTGTASDGAQVRAEFDRLGRGTISGKLAHDGRWLWTEKHYDPMGREYAASLPYFDATRRCWSFRRFDLLGRVTYQREPYKTGENSDTECGATLPAHTATEGELPGGAGGGRILEAQYDLVDGSLIGVRTEAHGNDATARRVGVKWVNVLGRTRVVQDELGSGACSSSGSSSAECIATWYDHDAQGNLTLVRRTGQISAGGALTARTIDTTNTFNARGFKIAMNDPDLGSWTYGYNPFGELTSQTDAKGQLTSLSYDRLGRIKTRTEQGEGTTNWYYDETEIGGAKAIGKPTRVVGPGGAYEERYAYDELGRLISTRRKIEGNWYRIDQTYDAQNRLELMKYPSWNTFTSPDALPSDAERLVIRSNYNAQGYLSSRQNAATGVTYWRIDTIDQYGVTQETLGNGLHTERTYEATTGLVRSISASAGSTPVQDMRFSYDRNGNLLQRADLLAGRSEDFTYDAIDRLAQTRLFSNANWSGSPVSIETMGYDVFGNIRSKGAGYGAYSYVADTSAAGLCNAPANPAAQPHAVRQLTAGGTTRTLCYDRNGNLTRQLNGQYDTVTWWVANLARRISKGADYAEFTYGPDRMRYKQLAVKAGQTSTTVYVGTGYERTVSGGATEHTYNVFGDTGAIAIVKCTAACAAPVTKYVHRDHLGSVVALSDAAGLIGATDRMSFDAWGKRRSNTWASTTPGTQIPVSQYTTHTRRGFTGHEHLDFLGVVHMNGRIYDAEIGRFLSADPTMQFPESTQGFNRYSYAGNNPLSATDPSGFEFVFAVFIRVVLQLYMFMRLAVIAVGAPSFTSVPFGNPLESRLSVGFGTGRSGRMGQAPPGRNPNGVDLATGVLKRATERVAEILQQVLTADTDRTASVQAAAVRDNAAASVATVSATLPDPKTWRAKHLSSTRTTEKLTGAQAGAYFELAVKLDRAIGQYKEALMEMAKSEDMLTKMKAHDALARFENTRHKWDVDNYARCGPEAAACVPPSRIIGSRVVSYIPGHPTMGAVMAGNASAYGDNLDHGLLDVVAHEMAHTMDLDDALNRYLYRLEKDYKMQPTHPYEAVERHANDWMREVRKYYKTGPIVPVMEGVVVEGTRN